MTTMMGLRARTSGCLVLLLGVSAGCDDEGLTPSGHDLASVLPIDAAGADHSVAEPPDDAAPGQGDDQQPPEDLAVVDLYPGDASPCLGGYLNSNEPNACPLSCSPKVTPVADEGAVHLDFCTPIKYQHNPPASGNHWPWPGPWGIAKGIVPREWWVHNLEHQGIVLLYNCPYPHDGGVKMAPVVGSGDCVTDGGALYPTEREQVDNCPNEIATLAAFYNNHPPDNWFDAFFEVRIVVTQDPLLPTRFAAVAWDWVWASDQLDLNAIQCFIDSRYGRGPEPAP